MQRLRTSLAFCLATLAGVLLSFAFAPYHAWLLAPVSLALLYALLEYRDRRSATLIGWGFGLGYFAFGVHWIYFSLHLFGAAIAPLAAAITAVFVLVMSLFPATACWLFCQLRAPSARLANTGIFAAIWVLTELARGKIMGGFPWIIVGYSQTSAPLGALAPLVGTYAIGMLVVWLATLLPLLRPAAPTAPARRVPVLLAWLLLPSLASLAALVEWSTPAGPSLTVRLVQGNIPQETKFSPERLERSLDRYFAMTLEHLDGIDLVIWPETAIPTHMDRVERYIEPVVARLDAAGVDVLSGVFVRDGEQVYNAVRQLGGERAVYRKRQLVPFGEYMPARFVFDYAGRYIDIPMSDLARGQGPNRPLTVQGVPIGVSICYEDVFGERLRALVPASTLLVNVSNDAWFGDSAAPWQHEQKARMRARELARPLLRVTNTGVSSAIDERGRVRARIGHDEQGVLDIDVTPRQGLTPYAWSGNWPVFLLAAAICLWAGWQRHARRQVSSAAPVG